MRQMLHNITWILDVFFSLFSKKTCYGSKIWHVKIDYCVKKTKYNWHLHFHFITTLFCSWVWTVLLKIYFPEQGDSWHQDRTETRTPNICVSAAFQTLTFLIERLIWRAGQRSNGESRQVRKLYSRLGPAVAEFVQGCDRLCHERLLCSPFCKGRRIPGVHPNFPCLAKRSVKVINKSCWQKGQRHHIIMCSQVLNSKPEM